MNDVDGPYVDQHIRGNLNFLNKLLNRAGHFEKSTLPIASHSYDV